MKLTDHHLYFFLWCSIIWEESRSSLSLNMGQHFLQPFHQLYFLLLNFDVSHWSTWSMCSNRLNICKLNICTSYKRNEYMLEVARSHFLIRGEIYVHDFLPSGILSPPRSLWTLLRLNASLANYCEKEDTSVSYFSLSWCWPLEWVGNSMVLLV